MDIDEQNLLVEKRKAERHSALAMYCFFMIAVLTLVNSAAPFFNLQLNFLIGLGITQFIDGVAAAVRGQAGVAFSAVIVVIDLLFVTLFVVFGFLAKKRSAAGMIMGMVLYGFDSLLFFRTRSFVSIVFHCLALFFLYNGLEAAGKLGEAE